MNTLNIFDESIDTLGNNGSSIDWAPTVGKWHEARIVAIADLGMQKVTWQGQTKMQRKLSVMMAVDETIEFEDGKVINKTRCERFTASLADNSGLVKRILGNLSNVEVKTLRDLIGITLRIKLKKEGEYINLGNVDDAEKPLAIPAGLYVPKWWLQDKEGVATGYSIATEEGVKAELLPAKDDAEVVVEAPAPAKKAPAKKAPSKEIEEDSLPF